MFEQERLKVPFITVIKPYYKTKGVLGVPRHTKTLYHINAYHFLKTRLKLFGNIINHYHDVDRVPPHLFIKNDPFKSYDMQIFCLTNIKWYFLLVKFLYNNKRPPSADQM